MAALSDAFTVNTRGVNSINANAAGEASASTQISNFITAQSFATFAVAAPVLKTIWEVIKAVGGAWAKSYWTALAICLLFGSWQMIINLHGADKVRGVAAISSAVVVAIANSAILASSVIGITKTTGV